MHAFALGASRNWSRLRILAVVGLFASYAPGGAQDGVEPLRLRGLIPGGARTSVTESWGTLQFTVYNPNAVGRDARVAVFYSQQPEIQYSRDVWVPGRSVLTTWLTIGPVPQQAGEFSREFQVLLFDRTDGTNRLVLPPGEERIRDRVLLYRKREPTTVVMTDFGVVTPATPDPDLAPADLVPFVRATRAVAALSNAVSVIPAGPLAPTAESFDGVDVFVVAGDRLAEDPPGRAELRRWVQQGGRAWVMLDRVAPETVTAILGEDWDAGVVDRVGLTSVRLHRQDEAPATENVREMDVPVPHVRVIPSAADRVFAVVNGWPAGFSRRVGRGKVVFTTLGSAGWLRPKTAQERSPTRRPDGSSQPADPTAPVPMSAVTDLVGELHSGREADSLPVAVFHPLLAEEIGYAVMGRDTAAAILLGFVLVLVGLGVGLRRSRRPELVGWLAPVTAVAAAALFVALGEGSRQAVPPTVGVAAFVDPVPGSGEVAMSGLYAIYNPTSGTAELGTRRGAVLGFDAEGLDGQSRRRVQTDTDAWHWDGLSLPAGVRTGPFRSTDKAGRVGATVRFGPDGVEGTLVAGPFRNPDDAILLTTAREPLAVRFDPDGQFRAGPGDALPAGDFVAGAVLTDRQQRRQAVYRQLLTDKLPRHLDGREALFAWADPVASPVAASEGARVVGATLLTVPLEYERTPPGTRITVPRGFSPYRRMLNGQPNATTMTATFPIDMRLRFQLPESVLPCEVEKAVLFARVRAPGRDFTVGGVAAGQRVPLFKTDSPTEPVRAEIADASLLKLDAQGGLLLDIAIGGAGAGASGSLWTIDALSLEVVGRTAGAK